MSSAQGVFNRLYEEKRILEGTETDEASNSNPMALSEGCKPYGSTNPSFGND
jgi:hypothetical protein